MLRAPRYVVLLAILAGCGGSRSAATAEIENVNIDALGPNGVRVLLLDGGSEPLSPLRHDWRQARPEKIIVEAKMEVGASPPRQSDWVGDMWVARPTVQFSLRVEPERVTEEGDLVFRIVTESFDILDDVRVEPQVVSAMKEQMKPIKRTSHRRRRPPRDARQTAVRTAEPVHARNAW